MTDRRTRLGINGFGRIGRLVVRALGKHPELAVAHVNEVSGDVATAAQLLQFDTVHGRFGGEVSVAGQAVVVDGDHVSYSAHEPVRLTAPT